MHSRPKSWRSRSLQTDFVQEAVSATHLADPDWQRLREFVESDAFAFAVIVCGHEDLIPELHAPLLYAACRQTDKLIEALDEFDSYVTRKIRTELEKRNINWRTPEGRAALDEQLDFINIRWFRGSYKSSCITHSASLFMATRDPNITLKITHATDEKAWEFCVQIGDTIRTDVYQCLFPDRYPDEPHKAITQTRIDLKGRTVSRPQGTIQAGGYNTKDIGAHYDHFIIDDLVMEQNATPVLLKGVHVWLRNLEGYYIEAPGIRVRRVHVGTKWDEDDDDAFLTRGANARNCLTVRVPIEEFDGEVVNIMQAGTPTVPQLYSAAKIAAKKARVVNGTEKEAGDMDGARSWRCNYLLDAYAGGVRIFAPSVVDDPLRCWMGPYQHPEHKKYPQRFTLARLARDEQGRPICKDTSRPLDLKDTAWRNSAKVLRFDPWSDLDRVMTLDPSWVEGGDNWAITAAGIDHEGVIFQLETRADTTGMYGWIEALEEMDALYRPRVIGFDKGGYQEPVIRNLFKTDKRLRKFQQKIVEVPHKNLSKKSRIKAGVAEPLKRYALLLDPSTLGQPFRDEAKAYKADPNAIDGMLDSMSMVQAVARRVKSPEAREEARKREREAAQAYRQLIDPVLGVPLVA
jgi:hypothetical protein